MIWRVIIPVCALWLAGVCGYMLRQDPPVHLSVPNHEQQLKTDFQLGSWLSHNDPLDYDFPTLLSCGEPVESWLSDGLACVYGMTYMDETTRRCTVTLTVDNVPLPVKCLTRTKPTPSIP